MTRPGDEQRRDIRLRVIELGRADMVNSEKAKELVHSIEYGVRHVPDSMIRLFLRRALDFYWGGIIDPLEPGGDDDATRRQDG